MLGLQSRRMIGFTGALAAAAAAAAVLPTPAAAAGCTPQKRPPAGAATPLQNRLYDSGQLGDFATGKGIRIAVVDSGVDASIAQLTGRVEQGRDFLRGGPD